MVEHVPWPEQLLGHLPREEEQNEEKEAAGKIQHTSMLYKSIIQYVQCIDDIQDRAHICSMYCTIYTQ
jgi:hypothetical protein